jgi:hypothetical protein
MSPGKGDSHSHSLADSGCGKRFAGMPFFIAAIFLILLCAGCESPEMKGTPFYTGEYAKREGPPEQRVNAWPVVYYREPALSVFWPIFEVTDDHKAVRPLFSVYKLDQTNREYNVLWPLAQFDHETRDNRIFPFFWGKDDTGDDYLVGFPLYWHFGHPVSQNNGTDCLFPLWYLNREPNGDYSFYCPWPLFHTWSGAWSKESGSMVFPLYWHDRDKEGSEFYSLLWLSQTKNNGDYWRALPPLYYQASNETFSATATLLWAKGRSADKDWQTVIPFAYWDRQQHTLITPLWARWRDEDQETSLAPWLLSSWTSSTNRDDLWLFLGLAHASWGSEAGSHYVVPIYYRNAESHTLLTPLFGWQHGNRDYYYPITPLFGVRTGDRTGGSWLFPLYSHSRDKNTGETEDWFLLLGGNHRENQYQSSWFLPLYYYRNGGPLDSEPDTEHRYVDQSYGSEFWCLPFCWYENQCQVRSTPSFQRDKGATNAPLVREYTWKNGAFPLWSYSSETTPARNISKVNSSVGVILYDYRHEVEPSREGHSIGTNDYTRARILWRLWHYERTNGNVSVDIFPAITYDRRTDGYKKSSFLWRFFRYERSPDGSKKLDVLYIPLMR